MSLHYFPNIQWFSKIHYGNTLIEQYENYSKGSYRNRCHIIGGNGIQRLSIPLLKGKNQQTPIKDVKISYHSLWQKEHWQSIRSAYGNSPFYEFYSEAIEASIFNTTDYLFDFNLNIIQVIFDLIGLDQNDIKFTEDYQHETNNLDFRNSISPKLKIHSIDSSFKSHEYAQVFLERHGFVENLSILDLLFCTGPNALHILEESKI